MALFGIQAVLWKIVDCIITFVVFCIIGFQLFWLIAFCFACVIHQCTFKLKSFVFFLFQFFFFHIFTIAILLLSIFFEALLLLMWSEKIKIQVILQWPVFFSCYRLCRVQRRIQKGFDVFEYYANNQWDFDNSNVLYLRTVINKTEEKKYSIEDKGINYRTFILWPFFLLIWICDGNAITHFQHLRLLPFQIFSS